MNIYTRKPEKHQYMWFTLTLALCPPKLVNFFLYKSTYEGLQTTSYLMGYPFHLAIVCFSDNEREPLYYQLATHITRKY